MAPAASKNAVSAVKRLGRKRHQRNRGTFLKDIFIVRLINAFWIYTFFQPDEFFQSLEPAWQIAFGPQSGAWMTWEWQHQLRSSLHPALFSVFYVAADYLSRLFPGGTAVRGWIIVAAPKLPQAFFAALSDWYTWQLASKIYGPDSNVSYVTLFNPWQWYCSTRTFSNSLEMTLTIMALYYWPWPIFASAANVKENNKFPNPLTNLWELRVSLSLAAVAVVLRPTNVLIWLTIATMAFARFNLQGPSPLNSSTVFTLVREAALCGSAVLAVSFASDRLYFGFWTFPPYQWVNFNVSQSLAVFYGRSPWHYYLLQGLPLLCTTSLPFAFRALYKPVSTSSTQANVLKTLSYAVLVTVLAMSLISHKEVRFVYPLLPLLNILAAPFAASFFTTTSQTSPTSPQTAAVTRPRIRNKPYLFATLAVNLILAGYLSFYHQPAPINVLTYLRGQYERIHPAPASLLTTTSPLLNNPSAAYIPPNTAAESSDELFALFLMPCHSTPWRSHLIYPNLAAYALTCEPPLHTLPGTPERENYRDEADRFYDDPVGFLRGELFAKKRKFPTPRYIVGFEGVKPWLDEFLSTPEGKKTGVKQLTQVWSGFNGLFNEDWRRSGRMLVWDTGVYGNAKGRST